MLRTRAVTSNDKPHIIFNTIILASSILTMLFIIIVWEIHDPSVVLSYILSTIISLLVFHQLKAALLKAKPAHTEPIETNVPPSSEKRHTILLFVIIISIVVTPLVILVIIPHLWLIVLNGIVAGATISELVLHLRKNKYTR